MKILITLISLPLLLIGSSLIQEKGKDSLIEKGATLERRDPGLNFFHKKVNILLKTVNNINHFVNSL